MSADLERLVAHNLRAERARRRWTQAQLATRLGCSQSIVTALERGQRRVTLNQTITLCRALDVPLRTLLAGAAADDLTTLGLA